MKELSFRDLKHFNKPTK